jgi:hypothetical protein
MEAGLFSSAFVGPTSAALALARPDFRRPLLNLPVELDDGVVREPDLSYPDYRDFVRAGGAGRRGDRPRRRRE